MTTCQQIIDRARYAFRDAAGDFITTAELITYVNEGVQELAGRLRTTHKESPLTTTAGAIAAPADLIGWRWIRNTSNFPGTFMDFDSWLEEKRENAALDADAFVVTTYDEKLQIHPAPADGTSFSVGYYGLPAEITVVADTIPTHRRHDARLVDYVRYRGYQRLGDDGAAGASYSTFEYGLPAPDEDAGRNEPGQISVAWAPGPFDRDLESKHI